MSKGSMRIVVGVAVVVASSQAAHAEPARPGYYSAFDLEAKKIVVAVSDGATPGPGLQKLNCKYTVAGHLLTIEPTDAPDCAVIFAARQPTDFGIDITPKPATPPAAPSIGPLLFDHGLRGLARAESLGGAIDFKDENVEGRTVYFSKKTERWTGLDVTAGVAHLDMNDIDAKTDVFFRPANGNQVFVVSVVETKPVKPAKPAPFAETCKDKFPGMWQMQIDAANPLNAMQVVQPATIVEPNSFGVVMVRHSSQLVATFDNTGTVKLESPGMRDFTELDDARRAPAQPQAQAFQCTTYQVAPRAVGAYTITVSLVDPTKPANPVSSRKLDIIVLQRYAGAFRAGIAGILGASDQKFEGRTASSSSQAEIVRTGRTPVELVLGYSIYFSSLYGGHGRSYFTAKGEPVQDSHAGLFLGFGAISVAGTNSLDFLKSLHVGLEWEFSQYFAVAVTGVVRRVDELAAGTQVGGPAGMTIPTQSTYVLGAGVVLNISPSFFKFANTVGK